MREVRRKSNRTVIPSSRSDNAEGVAGRDLRQASEREISTGCKI
jgi:hypothetical protein